MKQKSSVHKQLGIKQEVLAMLLGVSRPRLAMFESGRRNLPIEKLQVISDMTMHLEQNKRKSAMPDFVSYRSNQEADYFLKVLKENEFRQIKTARRIRVLLKDQQCDTTRSELAWFLKNRATTDEPVNPMVFSIDTSDSKWKRPMHFEELMQLRHTLKVLELERSMLKESLE
ncbi:helix-turn-helix domain-containing protein [Flavobacterium silvaticum]|uniref:Helix-turn-helix transcriptional regulator n=1 Tax=Flavobacterium silvaticum TaxID=1852020 RepID=A0A972FVL7_9FLAO|nr:helix-turn-helix transcriptional regulator [Flavobacterium silvaticum]NMH28852.1 helix-turn-helix transcriptional regulator [Flavobacterium silvaticum]